MTDKFQNKYRIPSARAQWHDYSANGDYFITICTAGRECLFGQIIHGVMNYSLFGEMVFKEWEKSFSIRAELFCPEFVIMPNHLHAILRISVETHGRASLRPCVSTKQSHGIAYRPPKSISSFVAGFKSSVTKQINEFRNTPKQSVWQERFHDHIIRDDAEFLRISEYIKNNPTNWEADTFFNQ